MEQIRRIMRLTDVPDTGSDVLQHKNIDDHKIFTDIPFLEIRFFLVKSYMMSKRVLNYSL